MTAHRTLDDELQAPQALAALVLERIVEVPACDFPALHAERAHWDMDGQLRCAVCRPQREEEGEMNEVALSWDAAVARIATGEAEAT